MEKPIASITDNEALAMALNAIEQHRPFVIHYMSEDGNCQSLRCLFSEDEGGEYEENVAACDALGQAVFLAARHPFFVPPATKIAMLLRSLRGEL